MFAIIAKFPKSFFLVEGGRKRTQLKKEAHIFKTRSGADRAVAKLVALGWTAELSVVDFANCPDYF